MVAQGKPCRDAHAQKAEQKVNTIWAVDKRAHKRVQRCNDAAKKAKRLPNK